MQQQTDVVIIGAGPVGMITSLLLARQGHRVNLLERWAQPYPLPRAIAMSHESMRILQASGSHDLLSDIVKWDEGCATASLRASDGEVLMQVKFRREAESGWPEMQGFNQPDLEALLEKQVRSSPLINFQRGKVVADFTQDANGVSVTFGDATEVGAPAGAATETVRARYLVGCDGSNSLVRQRSELPVTDLGFEYDWLVVDIMPTAEREWSPYLGQMLGPDRPVTWAPSGIGRRRFEFMLMPGESREEMNSEATVWRLLGERGVTPDNAKLVRFALYTFRAMWADRWRDGRVLIAGDAAHLTPPFLGQGLNSGIRDAATLAWRLDLVLRGVVAPDTLDDYGSERIGHIRDVITQAVDMGRLICLTNPDDCEERDGMLRFVRDTPEATPPEPVWKIGAGAVLSDDPHAAALGLQGTVRKDGRTGLFDEVCGGGRFVLLARQANPMTVLSPAARKVWEQLGGIAAQVAPDGPVADVNNTYGLWFDRLGAEVILMRPDFYVFGTGQSLDQADQLVRQLGERMQLIA